MVEVSLVANLMLCKEVILIGEKKLSYRDSDWLKNEIINKNVKYEDIAKMQGVSERTIQHWASIAGIKKVFTWQQINEMHGEQIEQMYTRENNSIEDIYQKMGFTYPTIKKVLKHRGIKQRTQSESVYISATYRKRTYNLNEEYFECWTPEMSYIVGFINADGNIMYDEDRSNYTLQIALQEDDQDILFKIKEAIGYEGDILYFDYKRPNGKFTRVARLAVSSKKLVSSLIALGIVANKSLVKRIPKSLPDEFLFEYLRGYFDGNGNIDMKYERTVIPSLRLRLVSGSLDHVEDIQRRLLPHGFKRRNVETRKGQNTHVLNFYNADTHLLYGKFYRDKDNMFMARKKDKFSHCVNKRAEDIKYRDENFKRKKNTVQGIKKYV